MRINKFNIEPYYLGCLTSDVFGDELEYSKLYGFSCGIGDSEWWVESEIAKLSDFEYNKVMFILARNHWIKNKILTFDVVQEISRGLGCESVYVCRMPLKAKYELVRGFHHLFKNLKQLPDSHLIDQNSLNIDYSTHKFLKQKESKNIEIDDLNIDSTETISISHEQLEDIINKCLDRKIKTINKTLV